MCIVLLRVILSILKFHATQIVRSKEILFQFLISCLTCFVIGTVWNDLWDACLWECKHLSLTSIFLCSSILQPMSGRWCIILLIYEISNLCIFFRLIVWHTCEWIVLCLFVISLGVCCLIWIMLSNCLLLNWWLL